ncbi:unnamed protein product [Anisakis simplex]|uniref:MADS-box domain-containing protein n=1 Tax=Anisakis simplex TaxID=6269 RepID=A0A0M3JDW3_ANISI|nr:unnamed protein product [Anisakis simplex]
MAVENQIVFNGKYSSNKEKRKVKRLKKYVNEILLLSGEDPSHSLDTADIKTKLHCLREEVASQPQIEFRTNGLRGSRLGSERMLLDCN